MLHLLIRQTGDASIFDEIADGWMDGTVSPFIRTTQVLVLVSMLMLEQKLVSHMQQVVLKIKLPVQLTMQTTANTMGLGVKIAMGDMTPFFSYGSLMFKTKRVEKMNYKETGNGSWFYHEMGSDSVVVAYTTSTSNSTLMEPRLKMQQLQVLNLVTTQRLVLQL